MAGDPTCDGCDRDPGGGIQTGDVPQAERPIELVVGLGNPGERYSATRHNLGYRLVEELELRHPHGGWVHRRLCDVAAAGISSRLLLAKPLTFMNRSGDAVAWLLDHLELEPEQMLVAVDDVDLPLGTLRVRRSGGPGTHNGLRDICGRIGRSFPRIRLGVGGGCLPADLADYVTSPFDSAEEPMVARMLTRAADAVESAVQHGIQAAMSAFNGPAAPVGR